MVFNSLQLRELRRHQKGTTVFSHREIVDKLAPCKTYELPSHTVTVTDVTDVDFVGTGGLMLGTNKVGMDFYCCFLVSYDCFTAKVSCHR